MHEWIETSLKADDRHEFCCIAGGYGLFSEEFRNRKAREFALVKQMIVALWKSLKCPEIKGLCFRIGSLK